MFTISKVFSACCAHILTKVGPGHPCGRMHGHNYDFEFVLADPALDVRGFVVDYRDLDDIKKWIDLHLDHRFLNDRGLVWEDGALVSKAVSPTQSAFDEKGFEPSAENIARALYDRWVPLYPQLIAVRVRETPKTLAEYRP